jgi:hypothetical protein
MAGFTLLAERLSRILERAAGMTRPTIEAAEKPVLDIFCDKYLFRIPTYQRPYAWTCV